MKWKAFVEGEHECRNRILFFNLDTGVFQRYALFSPLKSTLDDGLRFLMSQLEQKIYNFFGRVNVLASHFINFHDSLKKGEEHPMISGCLIFFMRIFWLISIFVFSEIQLSMTS